MKKTILLSLLSLITIFSCAGGSNPPGPQPDPPGPTPEYIDLPTKIITHINSSGRTEEYYTYDDQGNQIKKETFRYSSDVLIFHSLITIAYDDYGNKSSFILSENDIEQINEQFIYQYDKKGNIAFIVSSGVEYGQKYNNKTIYEYDSQDRLITEEYLYADSIGGTPIESYKYIYSYKEDYLDYEREDYYVYDSSEYVFDRYSIQTFDEYKRVTSHTTYSAPSNEDYIEKINYTYDEYNCVTYEEKLTPLDDYTKEITCMTYYKNNPLKRLEGYSEHYKGDRMDVRFNHKWTYDEHDRVSRVDMNDTNHNVEVSEYYYE